MSGNRRILGSLAAAWAALLFIGTGVRVLASCASFGLPFTDLGSTGFCAEIAEAYYSGLTNGTSATQFSPAADVPREQMAAFVTRTLDQSLLRGNRRAALNQWWTQTPYYGTSNFGLTTVGSQPSLLASDGADIWVPNYLSNTVSRVRASDGKKLEDWTGASEPSAVLVAMGRVFVLSFSSHLYMIDPTQTAGAVTTLSSAVGGFDLAFDGSKFWVTTGSNNVLMVTPGSWSVTPVPTGYSGTQTNGILFDGSNLWVTDQGVNKLFKLDSTGTTVAYANVGAGPQYPAFDGHNIWVPNYSVNSLTVVRASDATVLKTFSAANGNQNGLNLPHVAAFDGQRVLVSNASGGLSLFKATDLSIIANPPTPGVDAPFGVCSDGVNFWVSFFQSGAIGRF